MTLCIAYPVDSGDIDAAGVGHMPIDMVAALIESLDTYNVPWVWATECDHLDLDDCGRPCHHLECPRCGLLIPTPDTPEEA